MNMRLVSNALLETDLVKDWMTKGRPYDTCGRCSLSWSQASGVRLHRWGAREKAAELAARCAVLWPLGPPKHGSYGIAQQEKTRGGYATASYDLFAHTVPAEFLASGTARR